MGTSSLGTALAFAAKFGITAAFSIIYVFGSELFPGDVRSMAMGVSNIAARLGGIISPQLLLFGQTTALFSFGVITVTACLMVSMLPETLGAPLVDNLMASEDPRAHTESNHESIAMQPVGTTDQDGHSGL